MVRYCHTYMYIHFGGFFTNHLVEVATARHYCTRNERRQKYTALILVSGVCREKWRAMRTIRCMKEGNKACEKDKEGRDNKGKRMGRETLPAKG